jgi:DNA-binding Lrp family transcriptional regulator
MTTKPTLSEGSKPQNTQLNNTDKQILQLLQEDFPLVGNPWKELSSKTGIPENQIVTHIKQLNKKGIIRKIGPIVDQTKIGNNSATLVALRVPEDQVNKVAAIINQYGNISHNYEREHEYNVWFTLVAQNPEALTQTLDEILEKTGLNQSDVLNLPTTQRFKIDVKFQLTPSF